MKILQALYIIWIVSAALVIPISFYYKDELPTVHQVWYHDRPVLYFIILCPGFNTMLVFAVVVALMCIGVIIIAEVIKKIIRNLFFK